MVKMKKEKTIGFTKCFSCFFCSFWFPLSVTEVLAMCQRQRKTQLERCRGLVGCFVTQCTASGAYSPMQCDGSTGYCWCVDQDGKKVLGTDRAPGTGVPSCTAKRGNDDVTYMYMYLYSKVVMMSLCSQMRQWWCHLHVSLQRSSDVVIAQPNEVMMMSPTCICTAKWWWCHCTAKWGNDITNNAIGQANEAAIVLLIKCSNDHGMLV